VLPSPWDVWTLLGLARYRGRGQRALSVAQGRLGAGPGVGEDAGEDAGTLVPPPGLPLVALHRADEDPDAAAISSQQP